MNNKIVVQGQCFLDKVIEQTGSVENAFAMTLLNERSITDNVTIGQELKGSAVTNKGIVGLFDTENRPATMITQYQIEEIDNIGIGKMIIGTDFIVA